MRPRILVIRGGALGDFILTLPAIRLLRENFPAARLEIIGYKHIVALAEGRFYADATRSIEYAPLAAFFSKSSTLSLELAEYFAGFQQIVSYLYDPDAIFEGNLKRAGVKNFLACFRKLDDSDHAARQLAQPLEQLALYLEEAGARVYPTAPDRAEAKAFLSPATGAPLMAIHPGSGSPRKNWPLARWAELGRSLATGRPGARLLLVGGEADHASLDALAAAWKDLPVTVARDLPLPRLAAVLEQCTFFLGHDSGVSHLAAAVERPCLLLFGHTDPEIWAPANEGVQVLRAPGGDLERLEVKEVWRSVEARGFSNA